ncbi:dipeptidyl peptidase 8-like isoform X2 [Schistocerca gregaria]|uniref:dipeptidyl peptidase 8-like isoform X2 n=1 Tax=Schistocerca gregaria TaxID=7010 RepID=UPI00211EDADB|nr:dipeptidyl peptidase 8-like isoform X2 [Schistocerca gregaria]
MNPTSLFTINQLVSNACQKRGLGPQLPNNFKFTDRALYFIGTAKEKPEVFSVDISEEQTASVLEWSPLIPSFSSIDCSEISEEEKLRRERLRNSYGLNTYLCHPGTESFLIPVGDKLYLYSPVKNNSAKNALSDIKAQKEGSRIDYKFSPNGQYVSFVRNNDIWIQHLESLSETRITYTNEENPENAAAKKASGVAEYVMQEEFDRYTGYWWSPDCTDKTMKILYVTVDESHMRVYNTPKAGISGEVSKQVYPLVGDENAKFRLEIAQIDIKDDMSLDVKIKHLRSPLNARFPSCEYIPRLGWTPNSQSIWVLMLNREQTHSTLVTIDIDQFVGADEAHTDSTKGMTLILEQTSKYWINVPYNIYWYKDGSNRVLLSSEVLAPKDSKLMRHLYMLTPPEKDSEKMYEIRPITAGSTGQVEETTEFWVNEEGSLVYMIGNYDSILETHLYVSSTSSSADPSKNLRRLTPRGSINQISMDDQMKSFVACHSSVKECYNVQIYKIVKAYNEKGAVDALPSAQAIYKLAPSFLYDRNLLFQLNPPVIFECKNSRDETIYGCYYKPKDFDQLQKYPVILYVYGGPHVQQVSNSYHMVGNRTIFQLWAHLGYLVVIIDGVGSWRRGLLFEGRLKHRMGTIEVQEQVDGLNYLMKYGFIDPSRIAVTGCSYGGYLALLCLAQRPDFFKLAIARAPVTMWEAYDTAYTERYMGLPSDNPDGYKTGSVLNYITGFPSEPNRLMIIHGCLDENVHLCHTLELIQLLIQNGKPYQLQVLPNERHGIQNLSSMEYLEKTVLYFLTQNL